METWKSRPCRRIGAALALDNENALALVKLGFMNQEGDPRTAGRTTGLTFVQGFMLDPAISRDLLRGGIDAQLAAGGQTGGDAESFAFRNGSDAGKTHVFARGQRDSAQGDRPNADFLTESSRLETTYLPSVQSNAYGHVFLKRDERGLPGQASAPVLDDRREFDYGESILGYRYRFGDRNHLWVGAFGNEQVEETLNPNRDGSRALPGISFLGIPIATPSAKIDSNCRDVEVRFDMDMGSGRGRPSVLTVGGAWPTTRAVYTSRLFLESAHYPDPISDPDNTGILTEHRTFKTALGYVQWA